MYQDAVDIAFDALTAEACHLGVEIAAFGEGDLVDVYIVQEAQAHTATIDTLDVFIDNGLDKVRFAFVLGQGVEIVGVGAYLLDHRSGLGIL